MSEPRRPLRQGIAQSRAGGGFADDAVVEADAAAAQMLDDVAGAVAGLALLVAGHQEGDATSGRRLAGEKALGGDDHGGEARLHVGGAAPEQQAIADDRLEGRALPSVQVAGRHHVRVAGKGQAGTIGAEFRVKIAHAPGIQGGDRKPQPLKSFGEQRLAAGILRGDRPAADQGLGQIQNRAAAALRGLRLVGHGVSLCLSRAYRHPIEGGTPSLQSEIPGARAPRPRTGRLFHANSVVRVQLFVEGDGPCG